MIFCFLCNFLVDSWNFPESQIWASNPSSLLSLLHPTRLEWFKPTDLRSSWRYCLLGHQHSLKKILFRVNQQQHAAGASRGSTEGENREVTAINSIIDVAERLQHCSPCVFKALIFPPPCWLAKFLSSVVTMPLFSFSLDVQEFKCIKVVWPFRDYATSSTHEEKL